MTQYDLIKKIYNNLLDNLKGLQRVGPAPGDLLKIDQNSLDSCTIKKWPFNVTAEKILLLS